MFTNDAIAATEFIILDTSIVSPGGIGISLGPTSASFNE